MSLVLDTDVVSALLKDRLSTSLARGLTGHPLAITFVTVGELTKWTLVRRWGPQRMAGLDRFFRQVVVLPYSPNVGKVWGELQASAQLRGRPRPANDTWIAACCIARGVPLATLNGKDFADFANAPCHDSVHNSAPPHHRDAHQERTRWSARCRGSVVLRLSSIRG